MPVAPTSPIPMTAGPPPNRLAPALRELSERFGDRPVTLGEVFDSLHERAYSLLVVLLALPFITPISLLGVSTLFGLAIAYLGVRLTLGLQPRLPERLRSRPLPPRFFRTLLRAAAGVLRLLERWARPRLQRLVTGSAHRPVGMAIVAAAVLLALPLPVPMSNTFPALALLFLGTGLLEEDGAMALAGLGFLLSGTIYLVLLPIVGIEVFEYLRDLFTGGAGG